MPTGPWTVVWVGVPGEDWTMLGSMDVMDRGRHPPTTHLCPCLTEQEKQKLHPGPFRKVTGTIPCCMSGARAENISWVCVWVGLLVWI